MNKEEFLSYLSAIPQNKLDSLAFKSITKQENIEFLKLLYVKRFINNPKNKVGQGLIHTAVLYNNIEALHFLIDSGLNVDEVDDDLRTPLHIAVMPNVSPSIISFLIDNNANINATTERLETSLFLACLYNNSSAVEILLNTKRCDISFPNDLGQEPISIAYKNNNKNILKLFKEYKKEN
jgi:ankyrin repeat protein